MNLQSIKLTKLVKLAINRIYKLVINKTYELVKLAINRIYKPATKEAWKTPFILPSKVEVIKPSLQQLAINKIYKLAINEAWETPSFRRVSWHFKDAQSAKDFQT